LGTIFLASLAVILRAAGAAWRADRLPLPARIVGWMLCTAGAWAAAGAAGAWCPIWPALLFGLCGALADAKLRRRELRIGADVVTVIACGLMSIPPVGLVLLVGTVIAVAAMGFVLDAALNEQAKRVRIAISLLPLLPCLIVVALRPGDTLTDLRGLVRPACLQYGLTPTRAGQRIVLSTGAVAWLERPAGRPPFPGALCFHGADRRGSRDASTSVIRRALLSAGFVVLSLDHPGQGQSPPPDANAEVALWDPLPSVQAALDVLFDDDRVNGIVAVGHSQGADDVFRLLAATPELLGAIVSGTGDKEFGESPRFWYELFHNSRLLSARLPEEKVSEILARFYDPCSLVEALPPDHAPLLFIRLERESPRILATRDALFARIPGRKTTWDLAGTSHFYNSQEAAGLIFGDTYVARSLAKRLRLYLAELRATTPPAPS